MATPRSVMVVAGATLALAGCAEHGTPTAAVPPGESFHELRCVASLSQHTLSCARAAGPLRDILGGQGVYLQLTSSNVAYDAGSEQFSADVVIRNLTDRALGTPDGATPTGVRAFLAYGPDVTGGTGEVSAANPSGIGTFTKAGQPYWSYPEILSPGETSAARTWIFHVPPTVETFSFGVLIDADLAPAARTQNWQPWRHDIPFVAITNVHGSSSSNVYAVGPPYVLHFDGARWTQTQRDTGGLYDVWTGGPGDAFGLTAGGLVRLDGSSWTPIPTPPTLPGGTHLFHDLWGSSAQDLYAVGEDGAVAHFDGTSLTRVAVPTSLPLTGVGGTGPNNVFIVGGTGDGGGQGVVLHWDGATWETWWEGSNPLRDVWAAADGSVVYFPGTRGTPRLTGSLIESVPEFEHRQACSAFGTSSADVYVAEASVFHHFNGSAWTQTSGGLGVTCVFGLPMDAYLDRPGHGFLPGRSLMELSGGTAVEMAFDPELPIQDIVATAATQAWALQQGRVWRMSGGPWRRVGSYAITHTAFGLWASGPTDAYVVGGAGDIAHFDGSVWNLERTGGGELHAVYGWPNAGVVAVGNNATFHRNGDGSWQGKDRGTPQVLLDLWGPTPSDIFAVGANGAVVRYDGSSWAPMSSNSTQSLTAVWGSSSSDVFAVGYNGTILHWNGAVWSAMTSNTTAHLRDVHGYSGSDVYAVGVGGVILHYDGTAWSVVASPTSEDLNTVWVVDRLSAFAGGEHATLLVNRATIPAASRR